LESLTKFSSIKKVVGAINYKSMKPKKKVRLLKLKSKQHVMQKNKIKLRD